MDSPLSGKVALVTGSSVGIGRETALALAREGCKVIITYRAHEKEAEEAAEKARSLGSPEALVLRLDVTDNGSIREAVSAAAKRFGGIDILINNAGVISWTGLDKQGFSDIESQVRTNLEGLMKVTREALPHVRETIINIASGAGKTGYAQLAPYCATKFGVRGFTQALAQELDGIRVVSVNPGMTATAMTDYRGDPPEKVADVIVRTARGELGARSGSDVDVWEHLG